MSRIYQDYAKTIIDKLLSFTFLLLLLLPFFLFIGIMIKLDSRGPIFFMQKRLGKDEKVFKIYKFRTMTDKHREMISQVFNGDPEVTNVGHFLRRTKLDELPQILNVLLGEMSFVGPRPCVPSIRSKFDQNSCYRFTVKPGLTSLAATKGSVYLTWPEKWRYDRLYVENLSLLADLKIMVNTVKIVLYGEKKLFENGNKRL
jgi:undecaprenyl phosphate N,N'-diacetylbacillosamine 1-phosphate transferase